MNYQVEHRNGCKILDRFYVKDLSHTELLKNIPTNSTLYQVENLEYWLNDIRTEFRNLKREDGCYYVVEQKMGVDGSLIYKEEL